MKQTLDTLREEKQSNPNCGEYFFFLTEAWKYYCLKSFLSPGHVYRAQQSICILEQTAQP